VAISERRRHHHGTRLGARRRQQLDPEVARARVNRQLNKRSARALDKWGGGNFVARPDGAVREGVLRKEYEEASEPLKWLPKSELWPGKVGDDDASAFGVLYPGHEVEVLVERQRYQRQSTMEWSQGVVVAVDDDNGRVAVCVGHYGTVDVQRGCGFLRRQEDAREMCAQDELDTMSRYRAHGQVDRLFQYALGLGSVSARSHAVVMLCRLSSAKLAESLVFDHSIAVNSIALRQLAHAHALDCNIQPALKVLDFLQRPTAAQLLVEVLAMALTAAITTERDREGVQFLQGVESNSVVAEVVESIREALPLLDDCATAVREQPPQVSREGLTDAFNELLKSCGRAHAVPVAFSVLEWMETLAVPKDSFTYEAIGLNVVKRVNMICRVWDLPNAPEETVPEVVFAGRSNVGKSSLVNMLLGRLAIAPTSSRPGRTKTMDFFDVNAGHPALPRFRLVDVPGLGFARASKDMRQRWVNLIGGYFVQRKSLKLVFHLLDAGLCEILPADRELWKLLAEAKRTDFQLCIALTKADHSLPTQMERFARRVRETLRAEGSQLAVNATIFACSAKSKLGKDTLWREIWKLLDADAQMAALQAGEYVSDALGAEEELEELEEEEQGQEQEAFRDRRSTARDRKSAARPARKPKMLQILGV